MSEKKRDSGETGAPEDLMRYNLMMQTVLRQVVRMALLRVAREGLPGNHHFFIAFDTTHPEAGLSERLRKKYPQEMTIIIQHQFWNLKVHADRFEVGLSFDNIPEKLVIPFAAVKGFFDPAVQFGLQFDAPPLEDAEEAEPGAAPVKATAGEKADKGEQDGKADKSAPASTEGGDDKTKVVSLDAFRKK